MDAYVAFAYQKAWDSTNPTENVMNDSRYNGPHEVWVVVDTFGDAVDVTSLSKAHANELVIHQDKKYPTHAPHWVVKYVNEYR